MKDLVLPTLLEALDRADVDRLVTVPASGLDPIYAHFAGRCLYATREEEAVAIAKELGGPVTVVKA